MAEALNRSIAVAGLAALHLAVVTTILMGVMIAGLCVLVAICLRGTRPSDRPAILYGLASVVRALRNGLPHDRQKSRYVDEPATDSRRSANRNCRPLGRGG